MNRNKKGSKREEIKNRINNQIKSREVMVVNSESFEGVYSLSEAISIARSNNLDLIEVSENSNTSICRIMEFSKFKYDQKKRDKELKNNSKKVQLKEVKFGPNTAQNDFDHKLKSAIKFLASGNKVKGTVEFKGREMAFKEKGELILLRLADKLNEVGKVDQLPVMNGRRMSLVMSPRT